MLRIGIVDDHQLFRKSLAYLISTFQNVEVVLEAENGIKLFEILPLVKVDLLLLDIQMPEMDGFETCQILKKKYPKIKILIVSQLSSKESIHKVMEFGVNGFFTKNSDPEQLELAIRNIQKNDFYFGQELGMVLREAILWEKSNTTKRNLPLVTLSGREIDVIQMACKEFNSIEIADKLCINVRTVETHRRRMMDKTNSKNFIGVILFAIKNNYVSIDNF